MFRFIINSYKVEFPTKKKIVQIKVIPVFIFKNRES